MELAWTVEQVFVRPAGAGLEVLMVVESPAGARYRERFTTADRNRLDAVRRAARWLALRGRVEGVRRLRLRVEDGGSLRDDAELAGVFASALRDALGEPEH